VMIENITRYIEAGERPLQAALRGSEQIGFTIISLTVSLIAVLIPLLFMADVVGRLFREFAITLAVTIIISAIVSLTLVPMMCAKLLRHRPPHQMSPIARRSQEWFDRVIAEYGRLLNWVLDHQPLTLLVAVVTLVLTVFLYIAIPKGFFPVQDTGLIQGITEAPSSVSFAAMAERQQALAEAVLKDSDVVSLSSYVLIDRATAGRFGITPATVDNALYDSFGQRIVSTIFTQSNQYRVILEADPKFLQSLSSFNAIYLPSSTATNGQVPLSAVAQIIEQTAPLAISHLGQFPATTVSFNLAPGAALGDAVDAIRNAEREIGLPPSMITSFQGAALAFQAALGNELLLIIAAIITVYIVLGVLYESYIHPITILSTLPSAGVGALLALMVDGSDLSIIAIIGVILLIGIVKKNGIMMV